MPGGAERTSLTPERELGLFPYDTQVFLLCRGVCMFPNIGSIPHLSIEVEKRAPAPSMLQCNRGEFLLVRSTALLEVLASGRRVRDEVSGAIVPSMVQVSVVRCRSLATVACSVEACGFLADGQARCN